MSGTQDEFEESGYTPIDLDTKTPEETDIEIIDGDDEGSEPVTQPVTTTPKPAAKQEESDDTESDTDEGDEGSAGKRKTRSQRLKAARDALQAKLAAAEARNAELEAQVTRHKDEATEGAAIGLDLYIQTINDKMKALRSEYDNAFDSGDRNKLWDVQTQMSELAAEKKQAERERRTFPTKAAPKSGGDQPQPAPTTQPSRQPRPGQVDPRAVEWAKKHEDWWGKDRRMTRRALVIEAEMQDEDFDPAANDDYYQEIDRRLAKEYPDKFGGTEVKPKTNNPTVQARGAPMADGKVRVRITAEDRRWADQMGLTIQEYARQKAKREAAMNTPSQYTEIL